MSEPLYGRTPGGQLLYDLAFARLTPKWIARKHKIPIATVRRCLALPVVKMLIRKNRQDAKAAKENRRG